MNFGAKEAQLTTASATVFYDKFSVLSILSSLRYSENGGPLKTKNNWKLKGKGCTSKIAALCGTSQKEALTGLCLASTTLEDIPSCSVTDLSHPERPCETVAKGLLWIRQTQTGKFH